MLAAVDDEHAGIASGVNNAVARVGSLLAVALLPVLAGLTGTAYGAGAVLERFSHAAVISAALCLAGGVAAALGIVNPRVPSAPDAGPSVPGELVLSCPSTPRACPPHH